MRFEDILNVLFFGFICSGRRNIRGDGLFRLRSGDCAEREEDGGNHKTRFFALQRGNQRVCVPLVGKRAKQAGGVLSRFGFGGCQRGVKNGSVGEDTLQCLPRGPLLRMCGESGKRGDGFGCNRGDQNLQLLFRNDCFFLPRSCGHFGRVFRAGEGLSLRVRLTL